MVTVLVGGSAVIEQSDRGRYVGRVGWAVLVIALSLVACAFAQLVVRLSLPTDGWAFDYGTVGGSDQDSMTFTENVLGKASPLQSGDYLLSVDSRPLADITASGLAGSAERPPGWEVGHEVTYTVRRDGQVVTLQVPVYAWPPVRVLAVVLPGVLSGLVLVGVALVVFCRRPGDWGARALLMFTAAWAVLEISSSTGESAVGLPELFTPLLGPLTRIFTNWLYAIGMIPSLLLLTLVFPAPKALVAAHPRLTIIALYMWTPFWIVVTRGQEFVGFATVALFGALSLASAGHTLVSTRDPLRQAQVRWAGLGLVVAALVLVVAATGNFGILPPGLSSISPIPLAPLAIVLGFGVAILRYRLFDIDLIINRALLYTFLTIFVIGVYVGIVAYLGALFRGSHNLLFSLIATGIVAVAFQPLRARAQRVIDHLLYGHRGEPYQVVAQLGQRLEAAFDPAAILPTIVETVRESLNVPYVAIKVDRDGVPEPLAAIGVASGTLRPFPLTYQGETLGELAVSPRRGEEALSVADERLLAHLAQQAGVAVHGVRLMADLRRLTVDLQRFRERLVRAREEERRRLQRDLHDDLAASLAGLSLTAGAVGDLVRTEPARATALADSLHTGIRDVVGIVRRIIYDLRPVVLDELGLVGAIRQRTAQLDSLGCQEAGSPSMNGRRAQFTVEAPSLPPLPAAVEVATYRIVQEALSNVARHAGGHMCRVRIHLDDQLHVEIVDDGEGIPVEHQSGVGLTSMRERAEELGGTLQIETSAAGTRVAIVLPIVTADADEHTARPDR